MIELVLVIVGIRENLALLLFLLVRLPLLTSTLADSDLHLIFLVEAVLVGLARK